MDVDEVTAYCCGRLAHQAHVTPAAAPASSLRVFEIRRLLNAENFATRLHSVRADVQRPFKCEQKARFFTASKDLLVQLDIVIERSEKVDLGRCRFPLSRANLACHRNDIPPDGRAPHATYALLATAHLTPLPKAKLRKVPERYVSNRRGLGDADGRVTVALGCQRSRSRARCHSCPYNCRCSM